MSETKEIKLENAPELSINNLLVSGDSKSDIEPDIETSVESRNIQDLSTTKQKQKHICSIRNYFNLKVFAEYLSGYVEMDLESMNVGKLEELLEDIKLTVGNVIRNYY